MNKKEGLTIMKVIRLLLLMLTVPVCAQNISEYFSQHRTIWEQSLINNSGIVVRKNIESFITREQYHISPTDYDSMHSMANIMGIAAKACIIDGNWEEAIGFLERAQRISKKNFSNAEHTFSKLITQHNEKIKIWKEEITTQEDKVKSLYNTDQNYNRNKNVKERLNIYLKERYKAIKQSESSIKEINSLLVLLNKEKNDYELSVSNWQQIIQKERSEIHKFGTVANYVVYKLSQIKNSDYQSHFDKVSVLRRMVKLDPLNIEGQQMLTDCINIKNKHEPTKAFIKSNKKVLTKEPIKVSLIAKRRSLINSKK